MTESVLEPNWMLCPTCMRPVYVPEDYIPYTNLDEKPSCKHCGDDIPDELLLKRYYDSQPNPETTLSEALHKAWKALGY